MTATSFITESAISNLRVLLSDSQGNGMISTRRATAASQIVKVHPILLHNLLIHNALVALVEVFVYALL
jgi:hypothetical protein